MFTATTPSCGCSRNPAAPPAKRAQCCGGSGSAKLALWRARAAPEDVPDGADEAVVRPCERHRNDASGDERGDPAGEVKADGQRDPDEEHHDGANGDGDGRARVLRRGLLDGLGGVREANKRRSRSSWASWAATATPARLTGRTGRPPGSLAGSSGGAGSRGFTRASFALISPNVLSGRGTVARRGRVPGLRELGRDLVEGVGERVAGVAVREDVPVAAAGRAEERNGVVAVAVPCPSTERTGRRGAPARP